MDLSKLDHQISMLDHTTHAVESLLHPPPHSPLPHHRHCEHTPSRPPRPQSTGQFPHYKDQQASLTLLAGSWSQTVLNLWVIINPSVQWANRQAEPFKGLPFGPYLRQSRPRRHRTLTAPLDLDDDGNASLWNRLQSFSVVAAAPQHTFDQAQSSFFSRLPLDVRVMIYELVLGNMTFHLSAGNQYSRILHYVCKHPDRINERAHSSCHDYTSSRRPSSPAAAAVARRSEVATGLLPLLVSCRRAYSEAIDILYSSNVFEFTQNFAAFRFLKVMLPPPRVSAIRHFRLYMRIPRHPDANANSHRDWNDLWIFFRTEMTGLKFLHLRLAMLEPMERRIRETADDAGIDWIEPMLLMALHAHRQRACRVEFVTGEQNTVHDLAEIFKQVERENSTLPPESVLDIACATVHRRVRWSLGGTD